MNCPKCQAEMQSGTASFMSLQGFPQMTCVFVSEAEQQKGFFKRKRQSKLITGADTESFYCLACDLVLPILE